jgi:CrcB protein
MYMTRLMKNMLLVFLGGGLGSALRYATVLLLARWSLKSVFPWSILVANLLGSFILGFLFAWPAMSGKNSALWFFLATGVLGGYTTFSTLSADSLVLWQNGHVGLAFFNSLGSAALGVLCAAAGWQVARALS